MTEQRQKNLERIARLRLMDDDFLSSYCVFDLYSLRFRSKLTGHLRCPHALT